ncbi:putative bifunctional diguanylate cyclase/phosphodiesterase [Thiohalomonas denitrificans]|uniref:Diguanylate cyclase/phosphodiesterase n=1 Tax=Thiohalomonas denitrificans TaxID=415747 RepID=A0A1G5QQZ5_9GAMM|nr:EAL domain-containing protein [Thiohalomonas denitrificans]SCZ64177.1 diguanylate cyclase/phosphodiesterase [Thiohalomonas denitrificans]
MDDTVVNLKKTVLLPFVLGGLVLLAVLLFSIYREESSHIQQDFVDTRQTLGKVYRSFVDDHAGQLAVTLDLVAEDKALARAFAARDRERLQELASPLFDRLRERYRITHFYFHDADRVNFLRVHRPGRFGDVIDRFTAKSAEQSGEPAYGPELGPLGTFTLRGVLPWRHDGELLGYLEVGKEIGGLIPRLNRLFDLEIGVLIEKGYLAHADWEDGLQMLDRKPRWDLLDDEVLVSETGLMLPPAVLRNLTVRLRSQPDSTERLSLSNGQFIAGTIPLQDAGRREVGRLLLVRDITVRAAKSYAVFGYMVAASLLVGPMLFVLFFISLARAERQMKEWRQRVTEESGARMQLHEDHLRALERSAFYDTLTGLPNRKSLDEQLSRAVNVATGEGKRFILALLNIQRVNEINVTLGHETGDTLLRQVAERLEQGLPDALVVARAGGDEFAVALPAPGRTGAADVVTMIRHTLSPTFYVNDISLDMLANIGIAACPDDAGDAVTLLRRADVAMRQAKRRRENYAVYDSSLDPHSTRRLTLLGDLRQAIEEDRLELYYQPQVSMKENRVVAAEALVRWTHPQWGPISPAEFIPIAEQTGVVKALTRWVLKRALAQQAIWFRQGFDLVMCVNLSAHDLQDEALPDHVAELIEQTTRAPDQLTLELTESAIMHDAEQALEVLNRFAVMGCPLSVDDFGTGYSSLDYLKRLPVRELKVDRSFVADMCRNENDASIVASTIGLAHTLGLVVVAEGVEDDATRDALAELACDRFQGFYISHPLSPAAFDRWLANASKKAGLTPATQT